MTKVDRNDNSYCHREERSDVAVSATAGVLTMLGLLRFARNDRIRASNDKLELSIEGGGMVL